MGPLLWWSIAESAEDFPEEMCGVQLSNQEYWSQPFFETNFHNFPVLHALLQALQLFGAVAAVEVAVEAAVLPSGLSTRSYKCSLL